jgi:hypothetical protein
MAGDKGDQAGLHGGFSAGVGSHIDGGANTPGNGPGRAKWHRACATWARSAIVGFEVSWRVEHVGCESDEANGE